MELQTAARPPSGTGSSSAAYAYPRWVILEKRCKSNADGSSWATAVDAKTMAAARTSNGLPIQVALSLQDPPAASAVHVRLPRLKYYGTVAAHGGSLLIEVMIEPPPDMYYASSTSDYFVYNVGDVAANPPRLPSLLLLPQYYPSESEDSSSYPVTDWGCWGTQPMNRGWLGLRTECTGILRRARGEDDDEAVVAELQMVAVSKDNYTTKTAELLLFSSGEWKVKRPRIWYSGDDDDKLGEELPARWNTTRVFAVGDTTLCWADTTNGGGLLFYDVLEESPSPWLHYVPLPKALPSLCLGRTVCAMVGGGGGHGTVIRLVNIFPRCCCGGVGASFCQQSHHAYTITTWTLRMDDDGVSTKEWVMDGMVDATVLWSLDAYKGLPRLPLSFPVVSMYEPHVICFSLCECYHAKRGICDDDTLWLVMVDMKSKTIRSVSRHPDWFSGRDLMSSNVSNYLNPYQTCSISGDDGTSMMGQTHTGQMMHIEKNEGEDDDDMNSMLQASSYEIVSAIREIPSYGLAHDDMLKAYQILSGDNGSRVRSLLRLPKNLRKDWLLIEIKADDAY